MLYTLRCVGIETTVKYCEDFAFNTKILLKDLRNRINHREGCLRLPPYYLLRYSFRVVEVHDQWEDGGWVEFNGVLGVIN